MCPWFLCSGNDALRAMRAAEPEQIRPGAADAPVSALAARMGARRFLEIVWLSRQRAGERADALIFLKNA
jgi:hypothetical protein